MAIQSMTLDPDAVAYTDDDIMDKINTGSGAIVREGALSQDDLNLVKTAPGSGEFQVKNIHRDAQGKLEVEYWDVPVT